MASKSSSSIKNEDTYDALRDKGYSKEKSARIANAQANDSQSPSVKGGKASPYESWTKEELYERAQELEIDGRSKMSKSELIEALRG
ncbi:Rho termination factor N-terminal domain-containing protein [Roseibium sp. FZY0029]|uniref:DUF7218 family protein n=1 Tax=Roseibium sp. FZY0029 TaxID=3116647 RepID=UPI002EB86DD6|nr:Rho termination factor N-terminal domain-containing protein [Roseibium sp. FZY0029]